MKRLLFLLWMISFILPAQPQPVICTFKQPQVTIHFGTGNVRELNTAVPYNYERVAGSCPTDGHYAYASYTNDCFYGDWFTLPEDHTPGDVNGNMMLVNAAPNSGPFLTTTINGLKGNTTYEFAAWLMNLCRISDKCPFPLLPNITIQLQTPDGKSIAQFNTGELVRHEVPHWTQYRAVFTTPPSGITLNLTMLDNAPGGCGNDFALDDITFRECIITTPMVTTAPKLPTIKQAPTTSKLTPKKETPSLVRKQMPAEPLPKQPADSPVHTAPALTQQTTVFPAPPSILTTRSNPLVKQIITEAGEIRINLYDNGEIDGDTVTVYHNNELLVAHARLSEKPISFHLTIDAAHPHHELIMVADNLGSIPPNTSLMIVTTGAKRYEVFISSSEQKNAKVVFDLKE